MAMKSVPVSDNGKLVHCPPVKGGQKHDHNEGTYGYTVLSKARV